MTKDEAGDGSLIPGAGRLGLPAFEGRVRTLARLGWWAVTGLVMLMTVIAVPSNLAQLHQVCPVAPCFDQRLTVEDLRRLAEIGWSLDTYVIWLLVVNLLPPFIYIGVAYILFSQRPDDRMAYFTSLTLVLFGGVTYPDFPIQLAMAQPVWDWPVVILKYLGSVCLIAWMFTFPTGDVYPRWLRIVLVAWMLEEVADVLSAQPIHLGFWPEWASNTAFLGIILATFYAQSARYRSHASAVERRQTRWVVYGVVAALGMLLSAFVAWNLAVAAGSRSVALLLAIQTLLATAMLTIPLSIGVAILRSHLYDIDLLINRTFFYGTMTAVLAGILAVSVELTKRAFITFTGQSSELTPIIATLMVVSCFDPIKKRVERTVDAHFKYPRHSFGPFGVKLREFVELSDPETLAATFLRQAVSRFGARSGAVFLGEESRTVLIDQQGSLDADAALTLPLSFEGRRMGKLILGPRSSGEDYGDEDRRSLAEMASLVARVIQVGDRRFD